jgi:type IV secretory pathway TrbF-like protein
VLAALSLLGLGIFGPGIATGLTAGAPQLGAGAAVGTALAAEGAVALNDYARGNDPFTKVGKVQVAVDISSVIRASNDSFRVAWIERRYENASLAATERWTAILTIVLDTPHDADRLRKNPLGVFVHAINWSKELG